MKLFSLERPLSEISGDAVENNRVIQQVISQTYTYQPIQHGTIHSYPYGLEEEQAIGASRLDEKIKATTWKRIHNKLPFLERSCEVCHETQNCAKVRAAVNCTDSPWNPICVHTGLAGTYPLLESTSRIMNGYEIVNPEEVGRMIALMRVYSHHATMVDRAVTPNARDQLDPLMQRLITNPHDDKPRIAKTCQAALKPISQRIITDVHTCLRRGMAQETKGFNESLMRSQEINAVAQSFLQRAIDIFPDIPHMKGNLIELLN